MEEFEIKFLEVDVPEMEKKLLAIDAQKIGEYFYKRRHFDYPDLRLDKNHEWVRVRDEGDKVVMTHKKRINPREHVKDSIIHEIEIEVSDYDKTCNILLAIGMVEKNYQESKRIKYKKGNVEYDIDFWPELKPYLEIEGESMEEVTTAAQQLGFDIKDSVKYTAWHMYKDKEINLLDYQQITFNGLVKK